MKPSHILLVRALVSSNVVLITTEFVGNLCTFQVVEFNLLNFFLIYLILVDRKLLIWQLGLSWQGSQLNLVIDRIRNEAPETHNVRWFWLFRVFVSPIFFHFSVIFLKVIDPEFEH